MKRPQVTHAPHNERAGAFAIIERRLVDYFDATLPADGQTILEHDIWYAEIGGHRIDLSATALAVAQALEGKQ